MLKISLSEFVTLGHDLAMAEYGLDMWEKISWDPKELACEVDLYSALKMMSDTCARFGARQLKDMLEHPMLNAEDAWGSRGYDPMSSRELSIFSEAFTRELAALLFLHIPATHAKYYKIALYLIREPGLHSQS